MACSRTLPSSGAVADRRSQKAWMPSMREGRHVTGSVNSPAPARPSVADSTIVRSTQSLTGSHAAPVQNSALSVAARRLIRSRGSSHTLSKGASDPRSSQAPPAAEPLRRTSDDSV